ncbi:MAG TPA: RidA family protein [Burkholderiaceae bacterium]|nr:RidA family protein [Burkholderiaceae bacterium]
MNHLHLQPAGLAPPRGYSHVVSAVHGTAVYIAGQVAFDADGRVVGAGDLRAQTEQAFRNLQRALEAASATFTDLVKTTIFVVDYKPEHRAVIAEVRSRFYGSGEPPASTLVGVQSLVMPELLIEVEAIAVVAPPETA